MNREQIIRPRQWWSLAFILALTLHFVAKFVRHGWDGTFYAAIGVVAIASGVVSLFLNLRRQVVDIQWSEAHLEISEAGKTIYAGPWDDRLKVLEDGGGYLIYPPGKWRATGLTRRLLSPEFSAALHRHAAASDPLPVERQA